MTYVGELADPKEGESLCRVVKVEAKNPKEALWKLNKQLKQGEWVYQICAEKEGCNLPQPVFDYMNGFKLYEEVK